MSVERDFIETTDTTPDVWQRVISMKKYLPRIAIGTVALSSSACNLASGSDLFQSTIFSGYFFGHTSDLVFFGDIKEKNLRGILTMGSAAIGSAITIAVAAKYGIPAGGFLTFGEGVISMGLTTMWGIMKVEEKVEELRVGRQ